MPAHASGVVSAPQAQLARPNTAVVVLNSLRIKQEASSSPRPAPANIGISAIGVPVIFCPNVFRASSAASAVTTVTTQSISTTSTAM